ncbi:hypothetical protein NKH77_03460 [Streptomyces sp. M19]
MIATLAVSGRARPGMSRQAIALGDGPGRAAEGRRAVDDDMSSRLLIVEYEQVKEEQRARIGFRDNLLYATLASMAAIITFTFQGGGHLELILLLPPASVLLGWAYLVNDEKISAIGRYVREQLDPRLSALVPGSRGSSAGSGPTATTGTGSRASGSNSRWIYCCSRARSRRWGSSGPRGHCTGRMLWCRWWRRRWSVCWRRRSWCTRTRTGPDVAGSGVRMTPTAGRRGERWGLTRARGRPPGLPAGRRGGADGAGGGVPGGARPSGRGDRGRGGAGSRFEVGLFHDRLYGRGARPSRST